MTIYHADAVKQLLIDAVRQSPRLELDLAQVAAFDSAGFQLLCLARQEARRLGHEFRVATASQAVASLIDFYNAHDLLPQPAVLQSEGARHG